MFINAGMGTVRSPCVKIIATLSRCLFRADIYSGDGCLLSLSHLHPNLASIPNLDTLETVPTLFVSAPSEFQWSLNLSERQCSLTGCVGHTLSLSCKLIQQEDLISSLPYLKHVERDLDLTFTSLEKKLILFLSNKSQICNKYQ